MNKTTTILKGCMIALGLVVISSFIAWIIIPANKPVKITSLSKSEIRQICDEDPEAGNAYYMLSAGEYEVLGRFYENTVKMNSVKHYEDVTYACYTVRFLDKNGETVVMAARTRTDVNDLEKKTGDVIGKVIALKEDLAAKQTQKYTGDQELERIILNETQDMDGKVKDLAMKAGLISFFLLIACIVIYWIKERK
ncbi:MAG: hypothetical protein IJL09_08340 [Lachnospiraceae bacterium]|nr:hypothetical protein [Lachnospiraceae bacterium]